MARRYLEQSEIPSMIEQLLPIWQDALDRLQAKSKTQELTAAELNMTIRLSQALNGSYMIYRSMVEDTKRELKHLSQPMLMTVLNPQLPGKGESSGSS